jgi:hypothetical protein
MEWPFLFVLRRGFRDADQWGTLYIRNGDAWEKLSSTYELPWGEDLQGRSASGVSRIKEGVYKLHVREDGPKGWRLELEGTGHRENIQVHRAHKSMSIKGCILPVDFTDFRNVPQNGVGPVEQLKKGEAKIQARSISLMKMIRARYEEMKKTLTGSPTLTIGATLPAIELTARQSAVV